MTKKIFYLKQVLEKIPLSENDIKIFEEEGLLEIRIENNRRFFLEDDLERLEIIRRLRDELGVNIEGIDVILHMRNRIISMQENFLEFIDQIKQEIEQMKGPLQLKDKDDIMPM
jgi:MerR family transcriptional regulator/heat shock protein HspR